MIQHYLFVYGTLRPDFKSLMSEWLAKKAEYFGQGYVNARLFEINGYPGVVHSSCCRDKVYGDVYLLKYPEKQLAILDDYEECSTDYSQPHEYTRKITPVYLIGGATLLTPGFITDLIGLSMLIPQVRDLYIKIAQKIIKKRVETGRWDITFFR